MTFPLIVHIESEGGIKVFESQSVNISRNAMEISGDGAMVATFMAQSSYPHFCEIGFRLPGREEELVIACQLTTHRRLSQHCYHLVFLFDEFVAGSEDVLLNCLEGQHGEVLSQAR